MDEGGAMHYADISDRIAAEGLRTKLGATPQSTVSATITTSAGPAHLGHGSCFGSRLARAGRCLVGDAAWQGLATHRPERDCPPNRPTTPLWRVFKAFTGLPWGVAGNRRASRAGQKTQNTR